ncbi:ABC transporter ATP-binding protein [Desulfonatronum thiodismutans]|uniref:ABC transporter ATP-binding protein n=1 Tax=Desulfonatronum thiodismutans TaxID=159290 RepID=UPI00068C945A|nr:ABC transporter ATP-binding protein [Desulfonatronum thiodismutans]
MANQHTDTACEPSLEVRGLRKDFGKTTALRDVSFTVPKNSLTVILGAAGAGKTTTLRIIAGLDEPTSGSVFINGRDVGGWEPKDRDVAMMFDNLALYPNKSGYLNIASPLLIQGVPEDEVRKKVLEVAETLHIGRILDRLPGTMSGGEKQRIALGRALIREPAIFLLDEPLSSLDAKLRVELRTELRRLQKESGQTFLLATPDYHEALAIADTVIMLQSGKVVQCDSPQALYDRPAHRLTSEFIGSPLINILQGRIFPDESNILEFFGFRMPLTPSMSSTLAAIPDGFDIGLRPENISITTPSATTSQGKLIDVEPLGSRSVLTIHNDFGEVRLLVPAKDLQESKIGSTLAVKVDQPEQILYFDRTTGQSIGMETNPDDAKPRP